MENLIVANIKKKGRPRKLINIEETIENPVENVVKKRGRKKKENVIEEPKIKKRRGRKAAIKFYSSTIRKQIPLTSFIHENDKYLLHIDVNEKDNKTSVKELILQNIDDNLLNVSEILSDNELNHFFKDKLNITENEEISLDKLYNERIEDRLIDDISSLKSIQPKNNDLTEIVDKDKKDDKESHLKNDKTYFKILDNYIVNNEWCDKINIHCWWCCHTFDTVPIGMPYEYDSYLKKFRVKGIYCSFACMLADNEIKLIHAKYKSLVQSLYKRLTGCFSVGSKEMYIKILKLKYDLNKYFDGNIDIQDNFIKNMLYFTEYKLEKAPPKCILQIFGGKLTIEEYRNLIKEKKSYMMIEYPMYISRDYAKEINIENIKDINKTLFIDKHNKNEILDITPKLEDAKDRINSQVSKNVITNNSINKFIKW